MPKCFVAAGLDLDAVGPLVPKFFVNGDELPVAIELDDQLYVVAQEVGPNFREQGHAFVIHVPDGTKQRHIAPHRQGQVVLELRFALVFAFHVERIEAGREMPIRRRIPKRGVDAVAHSGELGADFLKHLAQGMVAVGTLQSVGVVGGEGGDLIGSQKAGLQDSDTGLVARLVAEPEPIGVRRIEAALLRGVVDREHRGEVGELRSQSRDHGAGGPAMGVHDVVVVRVLRDELCCGFCKDPDPRRFELPALARERIRRQKDLLVPDEGQVDAIVVSSCVKLAGPRSPAEIEL